MTASMTSGWSRAGYERARILAEAAPEGPLPPFTAHCLLCAFPTLRYRPVRAGRSWMALCSHCGRLQKLLLGTAHVTSECLKQVGG